MPEYLRRLFVSIVVIACGVVVGCEHEGMPQAYVSGRVTFQGNPVSGVVVSFTPEKGPGAFGRTDEQGNYILMTKKPGDGAVMGSHTVIISQPQGGVILEKDKPPRLAPPPKMVIPPKYANPATSGLTADVKDGNNTIDFELTLR